MIRQNNNAKDITFEELMRQAAKVAQAQDAVLEEKAKERRRKEEDERRQKERVMTEKRKRESALQDKHREMEKRQCVLMEQKQRPPAHRKPSSQVKPKPLPKAIKTKKPPVSPIPRFEKKKSVHMSYEELMAKSKEISPSTKDTHHPSEMDHHKPKRDSAITATAGPSSALYIKRLHHSPSTTASKPPPSTTVHARDRIRLLFNAPAQKVIRPKRDRQSIEEIQREIRHSKGIYSDNEDTDTPKPRQRIANPTAHPKRRQPTPPLRMPFRRTVDPKRTFRKRPLDDDDDDDLDSFIVEDDDSKDTANDYSSEISKLFRYDRKRYANESVYSDDDMEANSMDVIREENRSARLARREDQMEEQLELERRKKRLAKAKGK